jgi:hypothetical protein
MIFKNKYFITQSIIRPTIYKSINRWSFIIRKNMYYNDESPNLENMGNRFIGKGFGFFSSINFSYLGDFVIFSLEPFYFINQNKEIQSIYREDSFSKLNDIRYFNQTPFTRVGFREVQFYLNYKGYGLGISNSNMWWGPGIHSSLTMSNNTSGFPHIVIGTMSQKKLGDIKYDFRYIFSKLNKTVNNPYFTAVIGTISFNTDPYITIGINRNILIPSTKNKNAISKFEADTILLRSKTIIDDANGIAATYFIHDFPKSGD